jgi:hypothetical protein
MFTKETRQIQDHCSKEKNLEEKRQNAHCMTIKESRQNKRTRNTKSSGKNKKLQTQMFTTSSQNGQLLT